MKPYEGCAVCAVNELRKDCTDLCVFTLASKEDLLSRLSDNIHYTPYEHHCIREALSDAYNFDYAIRYDVSMHVNDMINMDNGKLNDDSVNMPSKSKIVETIDSLDISNVSNKEELIGLIIINILKLF